MVQGSSALVLLIALVQAGNLLPRRDGETTEASRMLRVAVGPGQPTYVLRVGVRGDLGTVEVREAAALLQTLTCHLDGNVFVEHFEAKDLDFDGNLDLMAIREFGASWQRYCVWLYSPQDHHFDQDLLAEQMSLLYRLEVDPEKKRVLSSSIGPEEAMLDVYRIEREGKDRPYWPRLVPVESCWMEASGGRDPGNKSVIAVIRYEGTGVGRPILERRAGTRAALVACPGTR